LVSWWSEGILQTQCTPILFAGGCELARESGALAHPDRIVRWVESAVAG
jgi:hypothetical protein